MFIGLMALRQTVLVKIILVASNITSCVLRPLGWLSKDARVNCETRGQRRAQKGCGTVKTHSVSNLTSFSVPASHSPSHTRMCAYVRARAHTLTHTNFVCILHVPGLIKERKMTLAC